MTARLAFSPQEVADMLGVSRQTIYNEIRRGNLRAVKLGKSTLIPRSEVERIIEQDIE